MKEGASCGVPAAVSSVTQGDAVCVGHCEVGDLCGDPRGDPRKFGQFGRLPNSCVWELSWNCPSSAFRTLIQDHNHDHDQAQNCHHLSAPQTSQGRTIRRCHGLYTEASVSAGAITNAPSAKYDAVKAMRLTPAEHPMTQLLRSLHKDSRHRSYTSNKDAIRWRPWQIGWRPSLLGTHALHN